MIKVFRIGGPNLWPTMNLFHHFHENNSFAWSIRRGYIIKQTVDIGGQRTLESIAQPFLKGDYHVSARTRDCLGYSHRYREVQSRHPLAPASARVVGISQNGTEGAPVVAGHGTWDAGREEWRQLPVESALDSIVRRGGPYAAIILYSAVI